MEKYKTTLKSTSFLHIELKKAAKLYLQGMEVPEIKKKAEDENIFMLKTENRINEVASALSKRLNALDEELINKMANDTLETSKQIALYSIMKTDRLFFEFMQEVYKEKCLIQDYTITDKDFNIFFQNKAEQDSKVASWKDYTYYKLSQVYKRILIDAGLAKKDKKTLEITRPLVNKDLKEYLKNNGGKIYLEAMLGEKINE